MQNLLEQAIESENGVKKLAAVLGVGQTTIFNWRARGTPKPWLKVLELRVQVKALAASAPAAKPNPLIDSVAGTATNRPVLPCASN